MQSNFLVKKNKKNKVIYGEVYTPYAVDTDGEAMLPEDIEQMAWDFIASGRYLNIDIMHSFKESGAVVVESFIARKGDPDFTEGAWVLGIKVPDEIFEKVLKGELNGFSLGTRKKVTKQPVKILVEALKKTEGITEEGFSEDIEPHSHNFKITFDSDGNIILGETNKVLGHFHKIIHLTATEKSLNHRHRIIVK